MGTQLGQLVNWAERETGWGLAGSRSDEAHIRPKIGGSILVRCTEVQPEPQ